MKFSRSFALEAPIEYPHLPGAVAVVKSRPRHSFRSPLAQTLLLHVNAEMVRSCAKCIHFAADETRQVYSCCAHQDPGPLECSTSLLDDYLPESMSREDREAHPDFFTLAFLARSIPKLRARYAALCTTSSGGLTPIREAQELFQDAQEENKKAASWPYQKQHRMPYMSYPLSSPNKEPHSEVYPSRIDVYHNGTHAAVCNGWRFMRVVLLALVAQTAGFLASTSVFPEPVDWFWDARNQAEEKIRVLVDDFCASIPYIISPHDTPKILRHYPHAPGDLSFSHFPEPDLVASMSQLLPSLIVGSQVYCIPRSQRQWLQQYMTMLSKNPKEDREKAMRLCLAGGFDTKKRMVVPPYTNADFLDVHIVGRDPMVSDEFVGWTA